MTPASDPIEAAIQAAAAGAGQAYADARKVLLDAAPASVAPLRAAAASTDWRTARAAEMVLAWIDTPAIAHATAGYVQGNLPGRLPLSGRFSDNQRVDFVAAQGPAAVPRVLEMLFKTREYRDAIERSTLVGALLRLRDPRAVEPLLDALAADPDAELRALAAFALARLSVDRAAPLLRAIVADVSLGEPLRAAAVEALARLGDAASIPTFERLLADTGEPLDLRSELARAIGDLAGPAATAALVQALGAAGDELLDVLLDVLAAVGDGSSLPALRQLASSHPDAIIREAATRAISRVARRTGAP